MFNDSIDMDSAAWSEVRILNNDREEDLIQLNF